MCIDLYILLINCLWCIGVHVLLTYDFSIFNRFGNYFELHLSLAIPIHLVCLCALNTLVIYALGALYKYVYGD
jgi:hypothetical protein